MIRKVEISHKTVIFTIILILSLWFVFLIKDIILQIFVALLIMAVLNPFVTKLSKYRIPRAISVIFVYLILILAISFSISAITPPLVEQTTSIVNDLPNFFLRIGFSSVFSDQLIKQLVSQLGTLPSQVAKLTLSIFSNVISVIAVLILAFYLLSEREKLDSQLFYFFGNRKRLEVAKFFNILEKRLGGWARGQFTLMLVVGLANYIGLRLLGIPFALPLAILAGLFEIVPYIGPVMAAIPAVVIGFGLSAIQGFSVAALAFLVQQLENYVFVPKIMQRSANVNPIVTLIALSIGFKIAGIVGLLISVPVFITLSLIVSEYYFKKT